jgi:tripartite ATP-independent transporter DctM subunit
MEWYTALGVILVSLFVFLIIGLPIAFSFLLVCIIGVFSWWGGSAGLLQLINSIFSSVTTFSLMPVPMFILIGEVLFQTGMASRAIDVLDEWLGHLPGRLSLLAVLGGTVFATLSGSSVAGVATLGSVLVPEMEKRGYKKEMTLGPILGAGGLSMMIPPSALGVILAATAKVSVGEILIAILCPGLLLAVLFAVYIVIRAKLQPSLAPDYELSCIPFRKKVKDLLRYVLPLAIIIFFVTGVIFIGLATPSEAAAMGALSAFILTAIYGKLTWISLKKSIDVTLRITVMMLMIFTGSIAFSQILAFTGVTRGLSQLAASLPMSPLMLLIGMQFIILIMGTFIEALAIIMVVIPIYWPIIETLGFNPLWFATMMLLNMEMAEITPPYGLSLFVMKGVAPPDTTIGDVYKAGVPFLGLQAVVMVLLMAFPSLALWLPSKMAVH